jgi:amino-acid N-acetyltransferase
VVELKAVKKKDCEAICALLQSAELPVEGVREHFETFVKLVDRDILWGTTGLEVYGQKALLRSVAVAEDARGQGYGKWLVGAILEQAQEMGMRQCWRPSALC